MAAAQLVLVAALALAGAGAADVDSMVAGDGSASTVIVYHYDLDELGATERTDDSGGADDSDATVTEQEEATAEIAASIRDAWNDELRARPALEERLAIDVTAERDELRVAVAAVTEDADELAVLLDAVLGDDDRGLDSLFGITLPGIGLPEPPQLLTEVEVDFDGDFDLRAVGPAVDTTSGATPSDVDDGTDASEVLATLRITAPGELIDSNGTADDRTVTWDLDGGPTDDIRLRSAIDPSIETIGLRDEEPTSFPITAVAVMGAIGIAGFGVLTIQRRTTAGDR